MVAQIVKSLPAVQETQVQSLGPEDPLEEEMATRLQDSCLENRMDGGARGAIGHGYSTERLPLAHFAMMVSKYFISPLVPQILLLVVEVK